MVPHPPAPPRSLIQRFRDADGRERATAIALAVAINLLLLLLFLTLAPTPFRMADEGDSLVTFDAAPDANTPDAAEDAAEDNADEPPAEEPETTPPPPEPRTPTPAPPVDAPPPLPVPPVPAPVSTPYIPMTRQDMARADVTPPPAPAPARPPSSRRGISGPPDTGRSSGGMGDTEVVGTAPNGEPLYAAAWYRRPYPDELRGYLSTANGPGWGLVNCRTVADFRVEDCVIEGESPPGSNIARAVQAAAWQFRVRPPRVGGVSKVGTWVRIRIDYGIEERRR